MGIKSMQKIDVKIFPGVIAGIFALGVILSGSPVAFCADEALAKVTEEWTTLYKDVFDQNFYNEGINQLDLGRWGRKIFHKKVPSADINVFDEVPDSTFFMNRHAKTKLSSVELEKGYRENEGMDLSRPFTVLAAEQSGMNYGFLVEDAKKNQYLLMFDPQGHLEMNTGAEVAASRFYYAIGYNVPQYEVISFKPEQIKVGANAITCDNTGFVKKLTQKIMGEYLVTLPQTSNGFYRASASKVLRGKELGNFSFGSRRKKDSRDLINHRDRREIRGLGVFSAWLNNSDLRESNALDMKTIENGQAVLKHYLTNFTNSLGASTGEEKPPMFGFEYVIDYGEAFKSFLALGFREKPWQKQWREEGEKQHSLTAVGYFSNKHFDPAKYKVQLPYEAFRMVTNADGFWAAKIIMNFSDEDIRAMVKAGQYSDPEASSYIAKTLIERRDMIGKYWFSKACPLDQFIVAGGKLSFKDLAVEHGFAPKEGTLYHVEVVSADEKSKKIANLITPESSINIQPTWISGNDKIKLILRVQRSSVKGLSPAVTVLLNASGLQGIRHED